MNYISKNISSSLRLWIPILFLLLVTACFKPVEPEEPEPEPDPQEEPKKEEEPGKEKELEDIILNIALTTGSNSYLTSNTDDSILDKTIFELNNDSKLLLFYSKDFEIFSVDDISKQDGGFVPFKAKIDLKANEAISLFYPPKKVGATFGSTLMDLRNQTQEGFSSFEHLKDNNFHTLEATFSASEQKLTMSAETALLITEIVLPAEMSGFPEKLYINSNTGAIFYNQTYCGSSKETVEWVESLVLNISNPKETQDGKYYLSMRTFPFEVPIGDSLFFDLTYGNKQFRHYIEAKNSSIKIEAGNTYFSKFVESPKEIEVNGLANFRVQFTLGNKQSIVYGEYKENNEIHLTMPEMFYTTLKWTPGTNYYDYPTIPFIDNISSAKALFRTSGKVYVNNVEQVSGVTSNDFRRDLIYRVIDDEGTKEYLIILKTPQKEALPVISIYTDNGEDVFSRTVYTPAKISLIDSKNPSNNFNSVVVEIRSRGNGTYAYPQKPYRIKFTSKQSVFGLGAAKSWVLLPDYKDPTYMMTSNAMRMGRSLGNLAFVHTTNHVSFYMNGVYRGIYIITEQLQVNEHRVNIDEEKDFLIELDGLYDNDYKFRSDILSLPAGIKSPEFTFNQSSGPIDPRFTFIKDKLNVLENILINSESLADKELEKFVDYKSVVDFMLINEITKNWDILNPRSFYIYFVTNEDKFYFGPLWDFEYAYGGWGFASWQGPNELYFGPGKLEEDKFSGQKILNSFFKDPVYTKMYKERWEYFKNNVKDEILEAIDKEAEYLAPSTIWNRWMWNDMTQFDKEYSFHVSKMKAWLNSRFGYMDKHITNL